MTEISLKPTATAELHPAPGSTGPHGTIKFYQKRNYVLVVCEITALPRNNTDFFALHIHEGESCAGTDFAGTKGHYNPQKTAHPKHAGDLPPLLNCHGKAYMSVLTDRFAVDDILGRTVVIHSGADDFTTQPAGNAGNKIACGVIAKVI